MSTYADKPDAADGLPDPAPSLHHLPAIIDVHSHALLPVWLDALRKTTAPGVQPKIAGAPVPTWSEAKHLAVMDANGIAVSVLSWPSATSIIRAGGREARELARTMNEEFARIISRNPDRFGAFAILPMDDIDAALDEMSYALDVLHLDGISSSTHVNGCYLGEPHFDKLFAEMHRRSVTLFVHPTWPPGFDVSKPCLNPAILEFMFETTRMATNMVLTGAKERFSNINVICTHAGGTIPYLAPRISILEPIFGAGPGRLMLSSEEIFKGLSSFYFDLTAGTSRVSLEGLRQLVPPSRLLMGFDYPMMPESEIAPAMTAFDNFEPFNAADRALIMQGNAMQLFPRFQTRVGL
ncbi:MULTISPECIES: amidohydrolase family protein [Paraburkholderia]|uniref:Amidohydrolase family protein n=1 Tax=Paraburkholderia metrosideri TaxID=580937 RepID=A0ABW9E0T8_9BURK